MYNTLRRIREEKAAEDRGFTLIELLVVVVIIGILVAIAIPLYLNYRQGAENRATESDVRNAAPLVEQYYATNNKYPADDATFQGLSPHVSNGTTLVYKVEGSGYCIQGTQSDTSVNYDYQSATGLTGTGTCP